MHLLTQLGSDYVFGFEAILSPQMGSISKLGFTILNKEVNWFWRCPGEEKTIVAGELQVGAKITA